MTTLIKLLIIETICLLAIFGTSLAAPDFVALGLGSYPSPVEPGEEIEVEVTFANDGTTLDDWLSIEISVSSDKVLGNSDDVIFGEEYIYDVWTSGENWTKEIHVTVPTDLASGCYYLGYELDSEHDYAEPSEGNNYFSKTSSKDFCVAPTLPDFEPTCIGSISELCAGESNIEIHFCWTNNGGTVTEILCAGVFLSNDATYGDADDIEIGNQCYEEAWSSGGNWSKYIDCDIPGNQAAGSYKLICVIDYDEYFSETNENNNVIMMDITINRKPATPSAPTVAVGCGYIDLSWSTVSGATTYCVYRDGIQMTCIGGTSWRDSSPGSSQRCYQVSAGNACGESARSGQNCGTEECYSIEGVVFSVCGDVLTVLSGESIEIYQGLIYYGTEITNLAGQYKFDRLESGTYSIVFDEAIIYTISSLSKDTSGVNIKGLDCDEYGVPDIWTDIETTDDRNIPIDYDLGNNYPNPFNPVTTISFSLPVASQVSLDVFNIAGQKVATLLDGYKEAGSHTVTWDGGKQASGIYFYHIKAGEFTATRKMTLLK